ncbi:hypothetical protein OCOL_000443 [Ordospora colligata]|uniref:Cullin family profile domain-containing protein n=1 Tax=Ordospora colligata OC4 TaxID=1354746 RepID=A0A0B2UIW1_9MICR|nr:uncharacterized protein M896_110260 [Ordospora colligata OC4]KHN68997.1 hypothetical protein M896_110260 [Ordospora colligata OC4]TBU14225.1 hypothetical protein CWI40_110260 [Ordospora colligata]TBU14272.1 hypothetical protein CWI41_110260 [Ordospora colligata]
MSEILVREDKVAVMKAFTEGYLNESRCLPIYEIVFQYSKNAAYEGRSKACLKMIVEAIGCFIDNTSRKLCNANCEEVSLELCRIDRHLKKTEKLFERVFWSVALGRSMFFRRMFGRQFNRFVKDMSERIAEFVMLCIGNEISEKATAGYDGEANLSFKKQKLNSGDAGKIEKDSYVWYLHDNDGDEEIYESNKKIEKVIDVLKARGCFNMFTERIVRHVSDMYKRMIFEKEMKLSKVRKFIDNQRKWKYITECFYEIELELVKELVSKISACEIFNTLDDENEMRCCVDFFVISGEEARLVDAVSNYCNEKMNVVCADDFVESYYWICTKLKVIENYKGSNESIIQGIRNCKRMLVNRNFRNTVNGICRWTNNMMKKVWIECENVEECLGLMFPECKHVWKISIRCSVDDVCVYDGLNQGKSVLECVLNDVFLEIGEVLQLCECKKELESSLRKFLGDRLLYGTDVNINKEHMLIDAIGAGTGSMYTDKMKCMLKDFYGTEKFYQNDILLLRACKWPDYESFDLDIYEVNEVKEKYMQEVVRGAKKRICWNDLLSSCDVEILGVNAKISLIQYMIIRLLADTSKRSDGLKISKAWKSHMEQLIETGLVCVDGLSYALNFDWQCKFDFVSLVPEKCLLKGFIEFPKTIEMPDSLNDIADCRIMKEMKVRKEMLRKELIELVLREIPSNLVDERIVSLASREFLCIDGDMIKYIP